MTEMDQARLLTVKEVARTLNISVPTIWRWLASGDFPKPIKICGSTRWRKSDIDALIDGKVK